MSILALESTRCIPVIASYDSSLTKNGSIGNTWGLYSPMDHDRCNFMQLLLKNHAFPSRCGQSSANCYAHPLGVWRSSLAPDRWCPTRSISAWSLRIPPSAFPRQVLSSQLVRDPSPCNLAFLEKKGEWATSSQPWGNSCDSGAFGCGSFLRLILSTRM